MPSPRILSLLGLLFGALAPGLLASTTSFEFYLLESEHKLFVPGPKSPGSVFVRDDHGFSREVQVTEQPIRIEGIPLGHTIYLEALAWASPWDSIATRRYLGASTKVHLPEAAGETFYLPHLHLRSEMNSQGIRARFQAQGPALLQEPERPSVLPEAKKVPAREVTGRVLNSFRKTPRAQHPEGIPNFAWLRELGLRAPIDEKGRYQFPKVQARRFTVLVAIWDDFGQNLTRSKGRYQRGETRVSITGDPESQTVFPIQTRAYLPR